MVRDFFLLTLEVEIKRFYGVMEVRTMEIWRMEVIVILPRTVTLQECQISVLVLTAARL